MTTRSTTQPAVTAVSLAAARETLRIEPGDTSLDASITRWIKGITREAEHQLGRSLITQGWRLSLAQFPAALRLDYPPIVSVESVKFYDASNALQTVDPADYVVDTASEPGYIVPAPGKSWPVTFARTNAVIVDYTAGYGSTDATVPDVAALYIHARLVEQFDPPSREFKETAASKYVDRILDCREKIYQ